MVVIICSVKAYQGRQVDGSSNRLITETLNSIHYEFIIYYITVLERGY